MWNSRDRKLHYIKGGWPARNLDPSGNNVVAKPLVDPKVVLLPHLHIKMGLINNFVKGINQEGRAFKYIREKFPKLSGQKLRQAFLSGYKFKNL